MQVSAQADIDVIVLAGDRGPGDPLARRAGVAGKALVPVAGVPMLTRVLRVLADWPRLARPILVAPDNVDYREAAAQSGLGDSRSPVWVRPAASLSASVRAGLAESPGPLRLLLTADHALLNRQWLDGLASRAAQPEVSGLSVGLADWHGVMQRFPGSRRTRYRFCDRSVCGTNLFVVHDNSVLGLLETWQRVEQERKRPWRIVGLLGLGNLTRYLAGRLRSDQAFDALSIRLGVSVHPVLIDDPLAAVDVDSPADLELVESVLLAEHCSRC